MANPDLATVGDRIVRDNRTANSVETVSEHGPHDTFLDIEASAFGLEWGGADLGDWRPIAVEKKPDEGDNLYRIWLQAE